MYDSEFLMPVVSGVEGNLFLFFFYLFKEACFFPILTVAVFFIVAIKWEKILAVFVSCFFCVSYNTPPRLIVNVFLFYFVERVHLCSSADNVCETLCLCERGHLIQTRGFHCSCRNNSAQLEEPAVVSLLPREQQEGAFAELGGIKTKQEARSRSFTVFFLSHRVKHGHLLAFWFVLHPCKASEHEAVTWKRTRRARYVPRSVMFFLLLWAAATFKKKEKEKHVAHYRIKKKNISTVKGTYLITVQQIPSSYYKRCMYDAV